MPRRTLTKDTSWDDSRAEVAYARASLAAETELDGKDLAKHPLWGPHVVALDEHLESWFGIDRSRINGADGITGANARIRRGEVAADIAVTGLHNAVLAAGNMQRKDPLFVRLFPKGLAVVVKRALGRTNEFIAEVLAAIAQPGVPQPLVAPHKKALETANTRATKALAGRVQATAVQGAASDTVQAWKDKANMILRTLESALGDYAAKHQLPANWPDSFFVPPRATRQKQQPAA